MTVSGITAPSSIEVTDDNKGKVWGIGANPIEENIQVVR
jgi:hypothetical protein